MKQRRLHSRRSEGENQKGRTMHNRMIKKDSRLEIRAEHLKKLSFIYLRQSTAIPNVLSAEVKS
jgi:hypothetical protein